MGAPYIIKEKPLPVMSMSDKPIVIINNKFIYKLLTTQSKM